MKLKNYKPILTDDGSQTLFSHRYQEACHSTHGATEETRLHYIQGCRVSDFIRSHQAINILEVGFGTGIGLKETLHATKGLGEVFYLSFEIDPELVEYSLEDFNWKTTERFGSSSDYLVELPNAQIIILIGDARKRILDLKENLAKKFDVIYQDAFSPRRNADLWTKQWFEQLALISQPHVIMSTYSASSSIRKAMLAAGWSLKAGEKFGPKRTSTRADLSGESDIEIIERLNRSPAIILDDNNYQEYMNEKNSRK